jgi:tRNA A-37 threonylcarbamoyl transferase component Bud32
MSKKLGKYRVLGEIGRGGMAVVYRARQESLDRIVAIKELDLARSDSDPKALARFQLEARAAASLDHPAIITIHDFWERSRKAYIAMEFVDGLELKEALHTLGVVDPVTAARIGIELCRALSYAHERGIIHRDIKPGNVMLSSLGQVKLADFGIVLVTGSRDLTTTGQVIGTPSYMSPEQIRGGHLGPASDIFSLGVVMYEMVTGVKPFQGPSDVAVTHAIIHKRPARIRRLAPEVPRRLAGVIMKCLKKKPGRRYPTMNEVAESLIHSLPRRAPGVREAVAALVTAARGSSGGEVTLPLEKGKKDPGRGLQLVLTMAVAAILLVALVLWPREPVQEPQVNLPAVKSPATLALTVHAYPWAEVFLDGKSLGFTPRAEPFEVVEGHHTLILRNPHLGERYMDLEFEAERPETISVNLLEGGK